MEPGAGWQAPPSSTHGCLSVPSSPPAVRASAEQKGGQASCWKGMQERREAPISSRATSSRAPRGSERRRDGEVHVWNVTMGLGSQPRCPGKWGWGRQRGCLPWGRGNFKNLYLQGGSRASPVLPTALPGSKSQSSGCPPPSPGGTVPRRWLLEAQVPTCKVTSGSASVSVTLGRKGCVWRLWPALGGASTRHDAFHLPSTPCEHLPDKEEKEAEDEIFRQHHQLNGHEFDQSPGDSGGQKSLACYGPWGHKESGTS